MNKELFVSSTPHETKVGLVEDDLLAEIYLERENEYTLAGSIYKGRVTRVLPGMQSAFVDIGLERDAFLYVSDFMELEEHDEDLTDVVPANRGVQDLRPQPGQSTTPQEAEQHLENAITEGQSAFDQTSEPGEHSTEAQDSAPSGATQGSSDGGDRERGGFRGRRRRRGGRRDGRGDGRNDGRSETRNDGRERSPEPRFARPPIESVPAPRAQESGRSQQFGPPAGYQPILLPGESISKYRGLAQPPMVHEHRSPGALTEMSSSVTSASVSAPAAPVAATFPDDEPIFASASASASAAPVTEAVQEHDDSRHAQEDHVQAASTSVDWNREFRRQELADQAASSGASDAREITEEVVEEEKEMASRFEHSDRPTPPAREPARESEAPVFAAPVFAAPGTLEEETIDEEEADTVRYEESSDEGYDEFEEETRAPGQLSEVCETVDEIHMASLADAGVTPAAEGTAEGEEDTEELELEEAQAEAEALLDAEARGTGTVDARAEVRAPAGTAGYMQRAPRPRPGFD
ncbi:MAG: hypothetical protein WBD68_09885, partial [Candidatus Sulfotelmatobacter sp.]